MKKSVDKTLDDLSRKVMEDAKLDQPSFDFTSMVMNQIVSLKTSRTLIYKPLISTPVWILFSFVLFGIVILSLLNPSNSSNVMIDWGIKYIANINASKLFDTFALSNSMWYIYVVLAGMLAVQFGFLKNYIDKRFTSKP